MQTSFVDLDRIIGPIGVKGVSIQSECRQHYLSTSIG